MKDLFIMLSEHPTKELNSRGKLVYCSILNNKATIFTMDGKHHSTMSQKKALHTLKKCKATCGSKYTMIMILNTSYHVYTAIGKNLTAMYEKIISMYNNNAGTGFTIDNFATSEDMKAEHLCVYRINNNLIWFDDEYYAFPDIKNCLGDYFSLYRESNWKFSKDWFDQSLL